MSIMSRAMASSKKTVSSFPPGLMCLLRKNSSLPLQSLIQPNLPFLVAKHLHILWQHGMYLSAQGLAGRRFCQSFSQLLLQLPWHYTWFDSCSLLVAGISLATCCHKNWISFPSGWGTKFKDIEHKPTLFELIKSKHGSQTVANQVVLWPGNFQLDSLMSPTIFLPHQKEQTWKSLSFQKKIGQHHAAEVDSLGKHDVHRIPGTNISSKTKCFWSVRVRTGELCALQFLL